MLFVWLVPEPRKRMSARQAAMQGWRVAVAPNARLGPTRAPPGRAAVQAATKDTTVPEARLRRSRAYLELIVIQWARHQKMSASLAMLAIHVPQERLRRIRQSVRQALTLRSAARHAPPALLGIIRLMQAAPAAQSARQASSKIKPASLDAALVTPAHSAPQQVPPRAPEPLGDDLHPPPLQPLGLLKVRRRARPRGRAPPTSGRASPAGR